MRLCAFLSMNYSANENQSTSSSYSFGMSNYVQIGPNPEEEGELFEGDIEFDDPSIDLVSLPFLILIMIKLYFDIKINLQFST